MVAVVIEKTFVRFIVGWFYFFSHRHLFYRKEYYISYIEQAHRYQRWYIFSCLSINYFFEYIIKVIVNRSLFKMFLQMRWFIIYFKCITTIIISDYIEVSDEWNERLTLYRYTALVYMIIIIYNEIKFRSNFI